MASKSAEVLTLQQYRMRPGNLIRRAHKTTVALFGEACAELNITRPQFETLIAVDQFPGLNQITLARTMGIDRSTTTLILDGLAERRLVQRTVDPDDRRKRVLQLTAHGTEVLAQARKGARQAQIRLLTPLSSAEAAALTALLRVVVTSTPSRAPAWSMPEREDGALQPEASYLMERPSFLLRRAVQIGFALFDEDSKDLDLTPTQYGYLFFLKVLPCDHANAARLIGIERSTSDRLLERLKSRGYVEIAADAGKILHLSAKGEAVFLAARQLSEAADARQFGCLSEADRIRLLDLLDKLVFFHEG